MKPAWSGRATGIGIATAIVASVAAFGGATEAIVAAKAGAQNGPIAFARATKSFHDSFTYTIQRDGAHRTPLLPGFHSGAPHWAPDGRRIAVNSGLSQKCP